MFEMNKSPSCSQWRFIVNLVLSAEYIWCSSGCGAQLFGTFPGVARIPMRRSCRWRSDSPVISFNWSPIVLFVLSSNPPQEWAYVVEDVGDRDGVDDGVKVTNDVGDGVRISHKSTKLFVLYGYGGLVDARSETHGVIWVDVE